MKSFITIKFFISILLFVPLFAFSQNLHFNVRAGAAGYTGDLQPKAVSLKQLHPMVSLGATYDFSEHFVGRAFLSYMQLSGDDSKGAEHLKSRNLSFKTNLFEFELGAQYNIFSLNEKWWTPYVFAGIAVFKFDPFTFDTAGNKVFLKPLSTEGQGFRQGVKDYKLTQFAIPMGVGFTYSLNEDMRIGIELGYRKTFTDYIDDVSTTYADKNALFNARGPKAVELAWRTGEINNTAVYPAEGAMRGNPNNNDGYYYGTITFSVRSFVSQYKRIAGLPSVPRSKRMGCPAQRGLH